MGFNYPVVRNNLFKTTSLEEDTVKRMMMSGRFRVILALMLALALSMMFSPSVIGDDIRLDSALSGYGDILSSQDLVFFVCFNSKDVSLTSTYLLCYEDYGKTQLQPYPWNSSCYMAAYNLGRIDCNTLAISSEYTVSGVQRKITKDIEVRETIYDPGNVVDEQEWDGGFGNPGDTAVAVWLMSEFGDKYKGEMDSALEWLKSNRNNNDKCWPSTGCKGEETAKILAYLTLAGYNDSNRVFYDAKVWLESHQNFIVDDEWNILLEADDEAACNLTIDGSTKSYDLNDSYEEVVEFTAEYGLEINFTCEGDGQMSIRDHRNNTIYSVETNDDVSFAFPSGACWSQTDWLGCNNRMTVYAAASAITAARKTAAKDYLEDSLIIDDYIGKYVTTGDPVGDTAFYYTYVDNPVEVAQYLIFQQGNDGSFGTGTETDVAIRTMKVLLALKKTNLSIAQETISDSSAWIRDEASVSGYSNILADSLQYLALKDHSRRYLQSRPVIIDITSSDTLFELYNPTDFGYSSVSYDLSPEIAEIISLNLTGSLDAHSSKDVLVKKSNVYSGRYAGFITINGTFDTAGLKTTSVKTTTTTAKSGKKTTTTVKTTPKVTNQVISRIPVIITEKPMLEITPPSDIRIFGAQGKMALKYSSNADYRCKIDFLDPSVKDSSFDLKKAANSLDVTLTMSGADRTEGTYKGDITCTFSNYSFSQSIELTIDQYPQEIVQVSADSIEMKSTRKKPTFSVTNVIDEPIDVVLTFTKGAAEEYMLLDKDAFVLEPGESQTVTLFNTLPKKENLTFTDTLVVSALDQEISIPLSVEITYVPFFKSTFTKIAFFAFIAIALLLSIYYINYFWYDIRGYTSGASQSTKTAFKNGWNKFIGILPKKLASKLHIHTEQDDINDVHTNILKDHSSVASMIKIMISMNKDEMDIRKRLKKEGLQDEEINEALTQVHQEIADQEELEKEEGVIKVIKKMDEDSEYVRGVLKQSGFSDVQINQAFEEIEHEVEVKEKDLQERLKKLTGEIEAQDVSLLDLEKEKNAAAAKKSQKK